MDYLQQFRPSEDVRTSKGSVTETFYGTKQIILFMKYCEESIFTILLIGIDDIDEIEK